MAGDPIQKRILNLQYSGGNFALKRCESFKFDEETTVEVAVSTEGPIGHHINDQGGSFTLMVFAETGDPEVNWHRVKAAREQLVFTAADYPSGSRIQYRGALVEKVSVPTENNGKQMIEVSGKWLTKIVIR